MEPVSYRASAAFYPQSDQFILFADKQEGLLSLLDSRQQGATEELPRRALRLRP